MTSHNLRRLTLTVVLICLACSTACRRFAANLGMTYVPFTSVEGSSEISADVTTVEVMIRTGELRIIGDADAEVRVEAKVKIKESLDNPDRARGSFSDHVRIETRNDRLIISDAHQDAPDKNDWRVSMTIHLPSKLSVKARTLAGRIGVGDMVADVQAESEAGEIVVVTEHAGALVLTTRAGKIDVDVNDLIGPVNVVTSAGKVSLNVKGSPPEKDVVLTTAVGDVELTLPFGSPGSFDIRTDVGGISVKGHDGIQVQRSGVGAKGTGVVGDGGPSYRLEANAGSVRIH